MPGKEEIANNQQRIKEKMRSAYSEYLKEKEEAKRLGVRNVEGARLQIQSLAKRETVKQAYDNLVKRIPQDKISEVHDAMKKAYIDVYGEERFNAHRNRYHEKDRATFLFQMLPETYFKMELHEKFIEAAAGVLESKDIDEVMEFMDSYQPPQTHNHPVKFFEKKIAAQKEENEKNITDEEKLRELNALLDEVNDLVIVSSKDYMDAQGEIMDGAFVHEHSLENKEICDKLLETDKYKHLKKYLAPLDDDLETAGSRLIDSSQYGNTDISKEFAKDELKIKIPDKQKDVYRKIINFMKEKGMLSYGGKGGESGSKAYGFTQIFEAHLELERAIKTTDPQIIRAAIEKYKEAVGNMEEVFKIIRDELNPVEGMHLGNISSFRTSWVPAQFKDSLLVNAIVNGIYNVAVSLDNANVELDEMLERPNEVFLDIMKKNTEGNSPNEVMRDKPLSKNMLMLINNQYNATYPVYAVARNIETITYLSYGSPDFEHNVLAGTVTATYDDYANQLAGNLEISSVKKYINQKPEETLAGLFIVSEEDRDYDNLRPYEAVTCDGTKKIPPFNVMQYLERHQLSAREVLDRIKNTVNELSGEKTARATTVVSAIRGAQMAAYTYLMMKPVPENKSEEKLYKELQQILTSPSKAFESALSTEDALSDSKTIDNFKNEESFASRMNAARERFLNSSRQEAREAEPAYNDRARAQVSVINELKQQRESNPDNAAAIDAQIEQAEKALGEMRKAELERLEKAYEEGKLPADYFEQRCTNVKNDNFDKKVPFGAKECPSYKEFKTQYEAELKSGELTKADVKMFYERMVENMKFEENKFILTATTQYLKPKLEFDEPAAEALGAEAFGADAPKEEEPENNRNPIIVDEANEKQNESVSLKVENDVAKQIKIKEN